MSDRRTDAVRVRMNFEYNVGFGTFLALVFYGFAMRAVVPDADVTGEHAINVVWACFMIVYGSVAQLGITGLMVSNYRAYQAALGLPLDNTYIAVAWLWSLSIVGTFGILYPVLFRAIKT